MSVFSRASSRTRRRHAGADPADGRPGRPSAARRVLALAVIVATAAVSGCAAPTTTWSAPAARPSAPPAAPDPTPATTPAPPEPDEIAPAGFVALSDVDPTIVQDIRYQTDHNFVGRPIAGYREPLCLLTRAAAERLHRVQLAARSHGYTLKVYDCYRPQRAVDDFVRWGQRPDDQRMKAEFYPNLDKPALFAQGFIAGPTAHSRGSTVDLTLVATPPRVQRPYAPDEALASCVAPGPERFPDNTVEMGTGFDCFDPLAHTMNPRVTGAARQHRLLLTQLMAGAGFRNYAEEWWHYSLMTEPYPDTYFDFPVARAALAHP